MRDKLDNFRPEVCVPVSGTPKLQAKDPRAHKEEQTAAHQRHHNRNLQGEADPQYLHDGVVESEMLGDGINVGEKKAR